MQDQTREYKEKIYLYILTHSPKLLCSDLGAEKTDKTFLVAYNALVFSVGKNIFEDIIND